IRQARSLTVEEAGRQLSLQLSQRIGSDLAGIRPGVLWQRAGRFDRVLPMAGGLRAGPAAGRIAARAQELRPGSSAFAAALPRRLHELLSPSALPDAGRILQRDRWLRGQPSG